MATMTPHKTSMHPGAMTEAILIAAGDLCAWAAPESAERIAELLHCAPCEIVWLEAMPYLLRPDAGDVIVPVVFTPDRPRQATVGGVTAAHAPVALLTGFVFPAEQVVRSTPDDIRNAHGRPAIGTGVTIETIGFACILRNASDSDAVTLLLVGDAQQALESMDRQIAQEYSFDEGSRIIADAWQAAAAALPHAQPPRMALQRLADAAAAVLVGLQRDQVTLTRSERGWAILDPDNERASPGEVAH